MTVIDNIEDMIRNDNLLVNKRPDLLTEWDYEKNNALHIDINMITCGSNVKAWWRCSKHNHSFETSVSKRARANEPQNCPYCSNQKVLAGFNDLASTNPDLLAEWNHIKNNEFGLEPYSITRGSRAEAWWHCDVCNGEYMMKTCDKKPKNCPYCLGHRILKGFNDLASQASELMEEWDWIRNNEKELYPDKITKGSGKKASWSCSQYKHSFEMPVYLRTRTKQPLRCPYCSNQKLLKGFNDLASCYPDLIESEWDWIRNNEAGLNPYDIAKSSNIKAYWKCSKCSYEWKAKISNRTSSNKSGCPACYQFSHKSKQEDEVAEYINECLCEHYGITVSFTIHRSIKFSQIYKQMNINASNMNANIRKHVLKELDIYIPELGFAIEYDGDYWHSDDRIMMKQGMTNDEMHEIKKTLCKQAGIELYFITEHDWLNDTVNVKRRINEMINNHIRR